MRHLAAPRVTAFALAAALLVAAPRPMPSPAAAAAAARLQPPALPFERRASRDVPGAAPESASLSGPWLVAGFADRTMLVPLDGAAPPVTLPLPAPRTGCEGDVCVLADVTSVRGFDVSRRTVRWQRPSPGVLVADPLVRAGWVFLATTDGRVSALRAADGTTAWTTPPGPALVAPPSLDGNRLALATDAPGLVVLDVPTGRMRWGVRLDARPGAPRLGAERVFFGTDAGDFMAVDADSGHLAFRQRITGVLVGAPGLDEDHVYTAGLDGSLRAFDRIWGSQRWVASLPTRPVTGPVTDEGLVLVALRSSGVQAYLPTRALAATLAGPAAPAGSAGFRFAVPALIDGRGTTLRVVTAIYDPGDLSKWMISVVGAGTPLTISRALPPTIPGLKLLPDGPR